MPVAPAEIELTAGSGRPETEHERLEIVGLGCLAVAMTTAMALVTDVVFGGETAIAATTGIGVLFLSLWYVLPLRRRMRCLR